MPKPRSYVKRLKHANAKKTSLRKRWKESSQLNALPSSSETPCSSSSSNLNAKRSKPPKPYLLNNKR